jgi:hypothetical protein
MLDEGQTKGRKYLADAEKAALGFACNYIRTPLALIEAKLSEYGIAVGLSDAAIKSWKSAGAAGLNLGLAYENRARIAILMDDCEAFVPYSRLCGEQYLGKHNPALTAKYDKLIQEARKVGIDTSPLDARGDQDDGDSLDVRKDYQDIRSQLNQCQYACDRAQRALEILARYYHARGGFLFGLQVHGLKLLSSTNPDHASEQLAKFAEQYLQAEIEDTNEVTVTSADKNAAEGASTTFCLDDGRTFDPVLLYGEKQGRLIVVGLAALTPLNGRLRVISPKIVHAISATMLEKGDVVAREVAR